MAGAVMVEATRKRAPIQLVPESEVGFWDRPERLVPTIVGALANRMSPGRWILAIGLEYHGDSSHRPHLDANRRRKAHAASKPRNRPPEEAAAQFHFTPRAANPTSSI